MAWSEDGGTSWIRSGASGWGLFDPHLIVLPTGVLALFAGSYHGGGLRVLLGGFGLLFPLTFAWVPLLDVGIQ